MRPVNYQPLAAVSGADNQNGAAIPAHFLVRASVQVVVTGASTGSFKLQFSNDQVNPKIPIGAAPTNWSDIGNAVTVSSAAVYNIPTTELSYQFIRVIWLKNNGSAGTVTANIVALGV